MIDPRKMMVGILSLVLAYGFLILIMYLQG